MTVSGDVDQALPTYAVLVRFRVAARDRADALAQVARRLRDCGEGFEEVTAPAAPSDGVWSVTARFVVVSVEAQTAVAGVHATLRADGLDFEEVWVDARCA